MFRRKPKAPLLLVFNPDRDEMMGLCKSLNDAESLVLQYPTSSWGKPDGRGVRRTQRLEGAPGSGPWGMALELHPLTVWRHPTR